MPLNTCILASSYPTTNSFNFSIGSTSSCASPTVNNTLPTPTWGSNVRVCGGVQDADPGACGSGEICVPPSASPYGSLCIYRSGDHMCPAGFDGTRELVYDDFSDTRACSTCSCTKQNATCTATVTRYQNTSNNCSGSTATLSVGSSSSCITKSSQTSFRTTAVTKNPSASCAKSGGTLSGAASPTGPTTICCL